MVYITGKLFGLFATASLFGVDRLVLYSLFYLSNGYYTCFSACTDMGQIYMTYMYLIQ